MTRDRMRLAAQILRSQQQIAALAVAPRLRYSSLGGTVSLVQEITDADGRVTTRQVGTMGLQPDGSVGIVGTDGPKPPTPTAPQIAAHTTTTAAIRWDGHYESGAAAPADWARTEVYIGDPDTQIIPSPDTLRGAFVTPDGGIMDVAHLPAGSTTLIVVLVARSTTSAQSDPSQATPLDLT